MISAEPTDNIPMIGSKGLIEYEFNFKGVNTHSSMPIEGKNANKNAVKFLNKLLRLEAVLKKNTCNLYEIPYSTMNIGVINGGRAINVVPSKAKVLVDFRICQNDSLRKHGLRAAIVC